MNISTTFKSWGAKNPILDYVMDHSLRYTDAQKGLMRETLKHKRHIMLGAPEVLQLNSNLIQLIGAKKILDIGVYSGASSLAAALAVPKDGEVFALDITDEYLSIGRPFWQEAGVEDKIKFIQGKATDTLQKMIDEGQRDTFDFAFIDADKGNYSNYFELCMTLIRPGGIIAFDNTVWGGAVIDENDNTECTLAIRALNDKLRDDKRINLSYLMIGDGLSLCFKK